MARQLFAYGANQGVWKALNRFNISISLDTNCRQAIKDVNSSLRIGIQNMDIHSLYLLSYDNLGFKVKIGYDQYTMIQWIEIKKEQLRDMKLYPPEGHSLDDVAFDEGPYANQAFQKLRLAEHVWEDTLENIRVDDVLGFSIEDCKAIGESVYKSVTAVLMCYEEFPTYDDAIIRLRNANDKNWKKKYCKTQSVRASRSSLDYHFELLPIRDAGQVEVHHVSNYDANNAQIYMPMKVDLNKESSCDDLLKFVLECKEELSKVEYDESWREIHPLKDDVPMYLEMVILPTSCLI